MPKLYSYFGITVFFYSNEHEPVHVHGQHGELVTKAELTVEDGRVTAIMFSAVNGRWPLEGRHLKDFRALVRARADEIVDKWNDYFLHNKSIQPPTITQRLKATGSD